MKSLTDSILESMSGETRKYKIDRTGQSKIIVFDTENSSIAHHFMNIEGAQRYADDFDEKTEATKKIIKSADHNLRFIVIDFDNLTPEAKECISEYREMFEYYAEEGKLPGVRL